MAKRPAHQDIISPVKSDSNEPAGDGVTSEASQVPQEASDISSEVSEEALLKEFAELIEAEELSPYKEYEERIRPGYVERIPAIVEFLQKQRHAAEAAQAEISSAAKSRKINLIYSTIKFILVGLGLVFLERLTSSGSSTALVMAGARSADSRVRGGPPIRTSDHSN